MTCDVSIESAERASRGRAIIMAVAGAVLLAGMALYVATWRIEIVGGDSIKLVTAVGLATALLVCAWLEWR